MTTLIGLNYPTTPRTFAESRVSPTTGGRNPATTSSSRLTPDTRGYNMQGSKSNTMDGSSVRDPFTQQIRPDCFAVSSQMAGNGRDRQRVFGPRG